MGSEMCIRDSNGSVNNFRISCRKNCCVVLVMKLFHIKVKEKLVHKTDNMKEALSVVSQLFKKNQTEVYLHGGKLGRWR